MANSYYQSSVIILTAMLCMGGELASDAGALASVPFNPPKGGAPGGRGGASRGDAVCSTNPAEFTQRFMPLTPVNSSYGLTVAQRPTLFAYIPPSSARKAFFSLKDENGRMHYQTTLPIAGSGGFLRINLPESVPPLVVGKRYHWGVAVLCAGKLKPDSPFVSSWVQRIEPSPKLAEQISKTAAMEQASLYGTHGIWYDMLTILVDARQQQPNNPALRSDWTNLLSSVGLGAIASEPLK